MFGLAAVNDTSADLLAQLRAIHPAAEPGWWPPAPGWWLLGLLLLAALIALIRWLLKRWSVARRRKLLLRALDKLDRDVDPASRPHEYLAQINRLFRLVAIRAFPGTACVRLQGEEWVRFLASMLADGTMTASLAALASGPYQPSPEFNPQHLYGLARQWIQRYG